MESWIEEECPEPEARRRPPRRRALVGVALAVVGGTVAGLCCPISPAWFLGAGALLLLPLFVWVRWAWSTGPLLAAALLLVAAHARLATGGRPALSLPAQMARSMEYVQFVAVALEDASPRPARPGRAPDAVFPARVEGLDRAGEWRRVDDRIRVVLEGAAPDSRLPRYGERWRLRGLVRPAVARRSGLFRLPQNQAVVDADRAYFMEAGQGHPLMAWCMERRRACREILGRGLEDYPDLRGLVQSLMMGYREDLPAALRKDFAATGTVHIFAISGSHVAMVTVLIAGLLRALGIPLTRWFPILAPLLVVYTLTTGAATSAVRSCVMAVLMLAAPFLKRRPDAVSTLAAAALAILLAAPAQLGDLGFLLSFTAVAGLLAIPPVLDAQTARLFRRDAWRLPGDASKLRERLRRWAAAGLRYLNVTVGAWIATTPLTAYFFNLFSPVALAMNLLVIPAAFVILLAGAMSLVCAPLGGPWTEIFNHAACAVAGFLSGCIERAAALPGGHGFVRTPPGAGVLVVYLLLAAATIMARRVRGALAAGLALVLALALGWSWQEAGRCRVSVLDAGEGQAVLVKAGRDRVLVDAGPAFRGEETLRQLRREGVNRLAALVLSHPDAQHTGAARQLLREVPVREVWLPAVQWPSPEWKALRQEAAARGIPVRTRAAGDQGDWPGRMAWEVLWPPPELGIHRADDAALVLRVARFGAAVLLSGDAGGETEAALQETGRPPAAAVLVAGRHGDASATSAAWLEAVRPQAVLISAGPHADGRHPDDAVLARLAARKADVWRTDRDGTIHVELAGRPARWPGRGYRISAAP